LSAKRGLPRAPSWFFINKTNISTIAFFKHKRMLSRAPS